MISEPPVMKDYYVMYILTILFLIHYLLITVSSKNSLNLEINIWLKIYKYVDYMVFM